MANDDPLHQHADQRRAEETDRDRRQQVPVERAGQVGTKDALHRPRRIGADHQQFAVRHVDHAHDAVGDRQAERREQQDRTERETGEGAAEIVGPGQTLLDRADRRAGSGAHGAVGLEPAVALLLRQRQEKLANAWITALAERAHRIQADFGVAGAEARLRPGELQAGPDRLVPFRRQCALEQRQHLRVGVLVDFLRRLPANLTLGREQTQRRQRGRQLAAHAVVDADRLDAVRRRRQLAVAGGVEDPTTLAEHHHALAGERQRIPGHRLEHRLRLFRRRLDQRRDGSDASIRVVVGERLEQLRINRRLRAGDAQQANRQQ
ncbi:MAG: hypothetical protein AW08_02534 [Candidatus Accumulibacter adjunctus]|uniref:Uncharacterized protein n=1 Tax=Candidatus Accumulibacter adjunctus TaxID=1454001 RepID=A0A011NPN6_9PROT|nr:MAG: hypothetical protein AW08_02534 [Candidatus Accumulibacter adjunctus]